MFVFIIVSLVLADADLCLLSAQIYILSSVRSFRRFLNPHAKLPRSRGVCGWGHLTTKAGFQV